MLTHLHVIKVYLLTFVLQDTSADMSPEISHALKLECHDKKRKKKGKKKRSTTAKEKLPLRKSIETY